MKKGLLPLLALCLLLSGCTRRYCRVVFDPNGGTLLSGEREQRVKPGEAAVAPEVAREGYILRWDGDFSAVTGDMTVTAQWEKARYEVEFDLGEGFLLAGETRQSVPYGEAAVPPEAACGRRSLHWEGEYGRIEGECLVKARWERREADEAELAAWLEKGTVRLEITTLSGSAAGQALILRPDGLLATTARTIERMESAAAVLSDGRSLPVERVLWEDRGTDLALLQMDASALPFFPLSQGDATAAFTMVNGALTTLPCPASGEGERFSRGACPGAERGAAITDGYGELLGLWSESRTQGAEVPVVDAESIAQALRDCGAGQAIGPWAEERRAELERCYSPRDAGGDYHYSLVRTYQSVTGAACRASVDSGGTQTGYADCCEHYVYALEEEEAAKYEAYLTAQGFAPRGEERFVEGASRYYADERSGVVVDLFRSNGGELWIWVSVEEGEPS